MPTLTDYFRDAGLGINFDRNKRKQYRKNKMAGFTLIEVLVAIVILAIGLLALAGLQVQTMRFTQGANFRTVATTQANALAERVLANRLGFDAGNYNLTGAPAVPAVAPTQSCLTAAVCTPAQMALMDIFMWNDANARRLPQGVGTICIDSTPNDATPATPTATGCDNVAGAPYVIKVWWKDDRSGAWTLFVTSLQP